MKVKNKSNKRITFSTLSFSIGPKEEKETDISEILMNPAIEEVKEKKEIFVPERKKRENKKLDRKSLFIQNESVENKEINA